MKYFLIIYLWKLSFFIKLIQCKINITIDIIFPSIIIRPYPLTEQAIYDLKNSMRKAYEINDFDDDDDYSEDDDIEIDNQTITTTEIMYNTLKSSSNCFVSNFIYLLLLLLLIQTNK